MAEKALKAAQEKVPELGAPMTVLGVDEAGRLVLCAPGAVSRVLYTPGCGVTIGSYYRCDFLRQRQPRS